MPSNWPGRLEAGLAARRALRARNGALPHTVRDDVLLLMTELVTNAVRHADAGPDRMVRLELPQRRGAVRVAVCDEGPGFAPEATSSQPDQTGGRGLILIDRRSLGGHAHGDRTVRVVRDPVRGVTRHS